MVLMKNHYIPIEQGNADSEKPPSSYVATGTNSSATANTTSATGSPPIPRHKERAPIAINIPPFVTKLEDTKAGGQYLCNPCQAHCNSDIQLSQHLSSKKHMEKVSRKMMISNGSMGEVLVPVAEVTGRAPGKVTVFCSICKLAFSSQVVLDTHINGSKHQRKLKSIELMKSLEGTEPGFKFDSVKGQVCCTLCDVTFYSPQHIARHVAGEKHQSEKGKRENGEEGGTPAKKHCSSSVDTSGLESGSEATESAISTIPTTSSGTGSSAPNFRKKERPLIAINVPACVTKLEDTRAGGKFLCVPCQAHCNSDIQLSQHLSSKKHLDKVSGKKRPPPGPRGGGRGWKGGPYGRGGGGASTLGGNGIQSLDSLSSGSTYHNHTNTGNYSQPTFPDSNISTSYSDSYGLSSLGRGAVSNYGFGQSGNAGRGRGSGGTFARGETYNRTEGGYGRGTGTSAYCRTESYPQSEYGAEYPTGRTEDINYSRAAVDDGAAHHYSSGQNMSHVGGRGMPFTYTQPLSHNFVSGGTVL